jgi:hypothetical protein
MLNTGADLDTKGETHVKKTKNNTERTTERRLDEFKMAPHDGLDVHGGMFI